jgi:hypothetical protein
MAYALSKVMAKNLQSFGGSEQELKPRRAPPPGRAARGNGSLVAIDDAFNFVRVRAYAASVFGMQVVGATAMGKCASDYPARPIERSNRLLSYPAWFR